MCAGFHQHLIAISSGGFRAQDAREAGVSAAQMRALGCSAAALRAAGFSTEGMMIAGYSAKELVAAGCGYIYICFRLHVSSICLVTLLSVRSMRAASFTAAQLLEAGCTLNALRGGGYSLQQLRLCGFSASDLVRECDSSTVELRAAGYSAADCIASGITVSDMSCYTTLSGRVVRCGALSPVRRNQAIQYAVQGGLLHAARAAACACQRRTSAACRLHGARAAGCRVSAASLACRCLFAQSPSCTRSRLTSELQL
jgi:hypothetical protein